MSKISNRTKCNHHWMLVRYMHIRHVTILSVNKVHRSYMSLQNLIANGNTWSKNCGNDNFVISSGMAMGMPKTTICMINLNF